MQPANFFLTSSKADAPMEEPKPKKRLTSSIESCRTLSSQISETRSDNPKKSKISAIPISQPRNSMSNMSTLKAAISERAAPYSPPSFCDGNESDEPDLVIPNV